MLNYFLPFLQFYLFYISLVFYSYYYYTTLYSTVLSFDFLTCFLSIQLNLFNFDFFSIAYQFLLSLYSLLLIFHNSRHYVFQLCSSLPLSLFFYLFDTILNKFFCKFFNFSLNFHLIHVFRIFFYFWSVSCASSHPFLSVLISQNFPFHRIFVFLSSDPYVRPHFYI